MSAAEVLPERLLGRKDVAELFGVCTATIRIWEQTGKLPEAIRLGRKPRWTPASIARLLDTAQPSERRGA